MEENVRIRGDIQLLMDPLRGYQKFKTRIDGKMTRGINGAEKEAETISRIMSARARRQNRCKCGAFIPRNKKKPANQQPTMCHRCEKTERYRKAILEMKEAVRVAVWDDQVKNGGPVYGLRAPWKRALLKKLSEIARKAGV